MAFLTNPRPGFEKFIKLLDKYGVAFSLLVYFAGLAYFLAIAHVSINYATYFSENALLPGLVQGEFNEDVTAKNYHTEIKEVMKDYPSLPVDWLIDKFNSLNIDAYVHNFSLEYPLTKNTVFYGNNVYGIIKAPRSSSTEGLILTAPYRSLSSPHADTSVSIALLLAMAKFCRKQKYWAKDIIFLITDHEQLGTQAWLEAYHNIQLGSGILNYGNIAARAGSIQAAINLEIHSPIISYIDVKVEGLNGQLPNLDLVNLVHRLCKIEGIRHTFKNRGYPRKKDTPFKQWLHSFVTMSSMLLTQASCVPNGNHGLYHRFGIEAVTLEGYEPPLKNKKQVAGLFQAGRVLEGTLRSLNNLLERFHQSYFFYLLPNIDRFVPIGTYIPSIILIGAPLALKGLTLWLKVFDVGRPRNQMIKSKKKSKNDSEEKKSKNDTGEKKSKNDTEEKKSSDETEAKETKEEEKSDEEPKEDVETLKSDDETKSDEGTSMVGTKGPVKRENIRLSRLVIFLLLSHNFGILFANFGVDSAILGQSLDVSAKNSIYIIKFFLFLGSVYAPQLFKFNKKELDFLNIFALLELITFFLIFSMHNFSLAFILSVIYVPCVTFISSRSGWNKKFVLSYLMLIVNPFILVHIVVFVYTAVTQGEENFIEVVFTAIQHTFVYFTVDDLIYGNWFLMAVFGILIPNWVVFWTTLTC